MKTTRATAPAGTGLAHFPAKPKPAKAAATADMPIVDRILDAIARTPRVRGDALGEVVGRSGNYVRAALAPYIDSGMVLTAKVSVGGRSEINEYVMATAVPPDWRSVRGQYLSGRTGRTPKIWPAPHSVLRKLDHGRIAYGGRRWDLSWSPLRHGAEVRVWPTESPGRIRVAAADDRFEDSVLITPDTVVEASTPAQPPADCRAAGGRPAGGGGTDGVIPSPSENPGSGRSDPPPEAPVLAVEPAPSAPLSGAAGEGTRPAAEAEPLATPTPARVALFAEPMGEGAPAPATKPAGDGGWAAATRAVFDEADEAEPASYCLASDGSLTIVVDDAGHVLPLPDVVRLCQMLADCSDWITRLAREANVPHA